LNAPWKAVGKFFRKKQTYLFIQEHIQGSDLLSVITVINSFHHKEILKIMFEDTQMRGITLFIYIIYSLDPMDAQRAKNCFSENIYYQSIMRVSTN
jgi:hypothetical protein